TILGKSSFSKNPSTCIPGPVAIMQGRQVEDNGSHRLAEAESLTCRKAVVARPFSLGDAREFCPRHLAAPCPCQLWGGASRFGSSKSKTPAAARRRGSGYRPTGIGFKTPLRRQLPPAH